MVRLAHFPGLEKGLFFPGQERKCSELPGLEVPSAPQGARQAYQRAPSGTVLSKPQDTSRSNMHPGGQELTEHSQDSIARSFLMVSAWVCSLDLASSLAFTGSRRSSNVAIKFPLFLLSKVRVNG